MIILEKNQHYMLANWWRLNGGKTTEFQYFFSIYNIF